MEALLAIGGEGPAAPALAHRLPGFGLVCAADSGLDLLRAWGVAPGLIVGDMDSLSDPALPDSYPGAEVLRFPRDKDESDTEIGLRILRDRGATRVVIAGGGGGRLDHLLAVRSLFDRDLHPDEWHTATDSCLRLDEGRTLRVGTVVGERLSVFPLGGGASSMESRGLRWPLRGLCWSAADFGLSNEATGGEVELRAGEGCLLVVMGARPAGRPLRFSID
jgi:thiamine pyrophosphokinase